MTRRTRADRGQAGGAEVVALGILVLLGGLLVGVNAWSVFWSRMTADAVAREYLRAYTEAESPLTARSEGRAAAAAVIDGRDLDPRRVQLDEPVGFTACARVEITVALEVPRIRIPFAGGAGRTTVRVDHTERIDAHRAGPLLVDEERPPCAVP